MTAVESLDALRQARGHAVEVAVEEIEIVDRPSGENEPNVTGGRTGGVLTLAGRVVLLLHSYYPEPTWPDDCGLVGEHPRLQQLRALVSAVADRDIPVLLKGEYGPGKALVARALHDRSPRRCAGLNL